jgi:protein TonB
MLKKEVIRVVSSSPDWKPGKQGGKAVDVIFTFPVSFILQ